MLSEHLTYLAQYNNIYNNAVDRFLAKPVAVMIATFQLEDYYREKAVNVVLNINIFFGYNYKLYFIFIFSTMTYFSYLNYLNIPTLLESAVQILYYEVIACAV